MSDFLFEAVKKRKYECNTCNREPLIFLSVFFCNLLSCFLHYIEICKAKGKGFKTACISLNFTLPLSEKASLFALVPGILTRSSEKYPSVKILERKAASLYGADIAAAQYFTAQEIYPLSVFLISPIHFFASPPNSAPEPAKAFLNSSAVSVSVDE